MFYKEKIQNEIINALDGMSKSVVIDKPKLKEHGDVSTNIAMVLGKELKRNPFEIANEIAGKIKTISKLISHVEVAKPGFINIFVDDYALSESLTDVHKLGENFGFNQEKKKEKILVEFVSANPTGDLHIGHARQAVIGDMLASLLEADGFNVQREFYINDYGEQISLLKDSTWAVYKKLKGETVEWREEFYPEEIVIPYVKEVIKNNSLELTKETLGVAVKDLILNSQKNLLASFGVNFNQWFSETKLHKEGKVKQVLQEMKDKKYTYEKEGAVWLKSQELGDTRDRVLLRSDGRATYLLPDIAYHIDKLGRHFDYLITIFGADHHGQEVSIKAGLKALNYAEEKLEIILVQMVSLKQEGTEVKMSKRAGTVVYARDILNEVGKDAFRYFLIESHPNNRMIFDVDLAKKQDKDNPVYYVQYAHARCCSIFRQITKEENVGTYSKEKFSLNAEEIKKWKNEYLQNTDIFMSLFKTNNQEYSVTKTLILRILDFPEEVSQSAKTRSPGRIANYLKDLATDFHQFYTFCRVLSEDLNLTKARLGLVEATKITIANGLKILGINAPESM